MAEAITARISGIPVFASRLRELSRDMQNKVVRSGALAAGNVFKKGAQANAPELKKQDKRRTRGALKRGIYAGRSRSKSRPGTEVIVVGVRAGKRAGKSGDPFYWRWQENGWVPRPPGKRNNGGDKRKALERSRAKAAGRYVPGRHYFQRSFISNGQKALDAFNSRLSQRIAKAKKELNGR
jgi:HK97 gp10 family phage protein